MFGIRLPVSGPFSTAEYIGKMAKEAEALDFDFVTVHDHMFWKSEWVKHHFQAGAIDVTPNWRQPTMFERLTTLSYIAGSTKKLRIGSCVLSLPLRNPILAARQAATIDALSGGRLILGVGLGGVEEEFNPPLNSSRIPWNMRGSIGDEYIQVIKQLWTTPKASFKGKYISYEDVEAYPKPVQKPHPPIWIGGNNPRAIKRIVKLGNGWVPGPPPSPQLFAKWLVDLKEEAKNVGRAFDEIEIIWEGYTGIEKTKEAALKKSKLTVENYARSYGSVEKVLDANLVGPPDEIIERVQKYLDVGVKHFQMKIIDLSFEGILKSMKLLSDEVFPSFRS